MSEGSETKYVTYAIAPGAPTYNEALRAADTIAVVVEQQAERIAELEAQLARAREILGAWKCSLCHGTGTYEGPCPDRQCGDSTWDHECGGPTLACKQPVCVETRRLLAALALAQDGKEEGRDRRDCARTVET